MLISPLFSYEFVDFAILGRVSSAAGSFSGARQRLNQNRATPDFGQLNLVPFGD